MTRVVRVPKIYIECCSGRVSLRAIRKNECNSNDKKNCFKHFENEKNISLNHAAYIINKTNFIKFIAGTIFIQKSTVIQKIKNNYNNNYVWIFDSNDNIIVKSTLLP